MDTLNNSNDANKNKYSRMIKDISEKSIGHVDVYNVLEAFGVTDSRIAHAIKKMLCPGQRGSKSMLQDLREASVSLQRAIQSHVTDIVPDTVDADWINGVEQPDEQVAMCLRDMKIGYSVSQYSPSTIIMASQLGYPAVDKIDLLTPQQEELLFQFCSSWFKSAVSMKPFDVGSVMPVIEDVYKQVGLDAPKEIIVCKSYSEYQEVSAKIAVKKYDKTRDYMFRELHSRLHDDGYSGRLINTTAWNSICSKLRRNVFEQVGDKLSGCNVHDVYNGAYKYEWILYYSAFLLFGLKSAASFFPLVKLTDRVGCMFYLYEDTAILTQRPSRINVDNGVIDVKWEDK